MLDLNTSTKSEIKQAIASDTDMQKWFAAKDIESMSVEDMRKWAEYFFRLYSKSITA